ncbi:hypothetical protein SDC9_69537 [bioreactor metagenome]|uniref:Phage holin family protein n=1 Tax=bioreactor metagenome TaxID=1076179 RepID=A0A644YAC8_9ZZZZ
MTRLFLKYYSIIFSVLIVSTAFGGVSIRSTPALLLLGFALLAVNLVLKPIFLLIALPLNILTFGLFGLLINMLTIKIADSFVPGVHIEGFLITLAVAFVITVFNHMLLGTIGTHSKRVV